MDAKLTKYLEMMHVEGLRRCGKCWQLRVSHAPKVAPWECGPCNAERIRAEKALAGCHVAIEGE